MLTHQVKEDIKRWISYGWEWRIIYKLLKCIYGIELSKKEIEQTIRDLK